MQKWGAWMGGAFVVCLIGGLVKKARSNLPMELLLRVPSGMAVILIR